MNSGYGTTPLGPFPAAIILATLEALVGVGVWLLWFS